MPRAEHGLVSERLLLRDWRDEDLAPFAALNADPEVMRHFPSTLSRSESDAMVERIRERLAEEGYGLWAVERKDTAAFIGFIGLLRPRFEAHFTPCVEIGWRLAAAHWGQGFAGEGAREVLRFAFEQAQLDEIVSMTSLGNLPSQRVMQKIGMHRDVRDDFDHPALAEGHALRRHLLYRLRRAEWLAADSARLPET